MILYIDIDDTICTHEEDGNYENARPIMDNIKKINELYDNGHEITYWSARGSGSGIDWTKITKNQFSKWGVKYHHLNLGEKPIYDLLIDDKAFNVSQLNKLSEFLIDK